MLQSTLTSPTNLQLVTDSALVALLICPQTPGPSTPLPFDTPAPAALSSPNSTPVLNEHLVALSDISQIYNIYFAPKSAGRSTPTTTPPPRKRKRVETPETPTKSSNPVLSTSRSLFSPDSQEPSVERVHLSSETVVEVQRRIFGFREVIDRITKIYQMADAAGIKKGLEAGSKIKDEELAAAEERGYVRGIRVVSNLCESPSFFPFNTFPVNGHPTIPCLIQRIVSSLVPPIPRPPPPLNLPTEYDDIPEYIFGLDPRQIVFILGNYESANVLIKLNYSIDLTHSEDDDETSSQLRGPVVVSHGESSFSALIIGHILDSATGVLVDEKSQLYLYTPANGEEPPWFGMGSFDFARVSLDEHSNMNLTYLQDVTVTAEDDSQSE